jgi:hypothetical protein
MNKETAQFLTDLAMSFYAGEPCRVCGELITRDDLHDLVFAGYSKDNKSRSAHGKCWELNRPKEEWAYPDDDLRRLER